MYRLSCGTAFIFYSKILKEKGFYVICIKIDTVENGPVIIESTNGLAIFIE